MLIKGENIENIATLSADAFAGKKFNFMLANPPYGKDWGNDMKLIGADKRSTNDPRFFTHTGKSDGQMMFLLNILSKMDEEKGSYCASVHNGSALFNSDEGQSAIRVKIILSLYVIILS